MEPPTQDPGNLPVLSLAVSTILLTVVALTAACYSSGAPPPALDATPSPPSLASPSNPAATPGPALYPGILALLGVPLSDVPEAQRPFFEDGEITFPEYEQAVLAEIECLRGHGMEVFDIALDPSGLRLDYFTRPGSDDPGELERLEALSQDCRMEHVYLVSIAWALATEPTEHQRQAAREALIACLRELGAALPDQATGDQLTLFFAQHPQCFEQVQREFRIPHYYGD